MKHFKPVGTPMSTWHKLSKNDDSKEANQTTYISMIEKLQYVVHTRHDIELVFGIVSRFSTNPRENNMMVVMRIMIYLKGTLKYGLWYKKGGNLKLKVFTNADWVGRIDDRKNTSGG